MIIITVSLVADYFILYIEENIYVKNIILKCKHIFKV